jgi:hypothetical protein
VSQCQLCRKTDDSTPSGFSRGEPCGSWLTTPIPIPQDAPPLDEGWLELDRAAAVEVTSEEKEYPVESALVLGEVRGWRAAASGTQIHRRRRAGSLSGFHSLLGDIFHGLLVIYTRGSSRG